MVSPKTTPHVQITWAIFLPRGVNGYDKIVHQQQNPLCPRLAAPIAPPPTDRAAADNGHPQSTGEHRSSNPDDTQPHLIRASDFSRVELKPAMQAM
jgi:hypothetical protein